MFCSLVDTSKFPGHGIYCMGTPFDRLEILSMTPPEPVLKTRLYLPNPILTRRIHDEKTA